MDPRGVAVFLVLSSLLGVSARANPELSPVEPPLDAEQTSLQALTAGDSTPLAAVKASLQALKSGDVLPPARSRALLAALTKSAAQLHLKGEPAAALARLKEAAAAAAAASAPAAEKKSSPDPLKNVTKRGDEFLAALAGPGAAAGPGVVANALPPAGTRDQLPDSVSKGALGLLNASPFGSGASAGALAPAANGRAPSAVAGVITTSPQIVPAVRTDLGIAVPAVGGPTPPAASLFNDAQFAPMEYSPAAASALRHLQGYVMIRPLGMPSLAPVAAASRNIAQEMETMIRKTDRAVAAAAPSAAKVKNVDFPEPPKTGAMPTLVKNAPAPPPPPHVAFGATRAMTVGLPTGKNIHSVEGKLEVEKGYAAVAYSSIASPAIKVGYSVETSQLFGINNVNFWAGHRPKGGLMGERNEGGVSIALSPTTQLSATASTENTRRGPMRAVLATLTSSFSTE